MLDDQESIRRNVESATTEDLLDRVTVYRGGMEVEALALIEEELHDRGVSCEEISDHARRRGELICDRHGVARMCSQCRRPATAEGWGWHRLTWWVFRIVPMWIPVYQYYCEEHRPESAGAEASG